MSEGLVRYRLAACCPKCRRRPGGQFYPSLIELARQMAPDAPMGTVVCTREGCRTTYRIAYVALQYAEAVTVDDEDDIRWAA